VGIARKLRAAWLKKYVRCRYPIEWDTEHHRHLLSNTREISLAARDSNDQVPDIRRQPVPARDKLAQGEISADSMPTGDRGIDYWAGKRPQPRGALEAESRDRQPKGGLPESPLPQR
jgi:hypothetical protein